MRTILQGLALLSACVGQLAGCGGVEGDAVSENTGNAPPAARAPTPAVLPAAKAVASQADLGDDNVVPLFPPGELPPHPDAQRLCGVIHDIPARARAACCEALEPAVEGSSFVANECVRTLSLALADGALTIDKSALDRCETAMRARVDGCDWVTPLETVRVPECEGITRGSRTVGGRCRSALECAAGLSCQGLGPTQAGVCQAPLPDGAECRPVTDPLAGLTAQDTTVSQLHPSCDGYCHARRCVPRVPLGGACDYVAACGSAARCADRKCVAGRYAQPGEACGIGSPCASGASCQRGQCVGLKRHGEPCEGPFECEASCIVAAGEHTGTCGPRCTASAPGEKTRGDAPVHRVAP